MRKAVGPNFCVKTNGGIHSLEEVYAMVKAGPTRIGASAGVTIVKGQK